MSKWYRFSLSLAAKCRVAFAFAVLLIIAAALFVPYRWMDKLVEQGKRELARAEVRQVLLRHFQPVQDPETPSKTPPLEPLQRETDTAQPHTRWIPLPDLQNPVKAEILENFFRDKIADNPFLQNGISRLLQNPETQDIFELQTTRDPDNQNTENKSPPPRPAGYQPSRYLYAVRAHTGCLTADCHAAPAAEKSPSPDTLIEGPVPYAEGRLVGVISVLLPSGQTGTTLLFNRIFIIAGGLISCVCAVVTFYLITQRFILQPVRSLRDAADKITLEIPDDDRPDEPSQTAWQDALQLTDNIKTGDEYENLAHAFHQMLSRLKLASDRLREINRALDLRLDELEAKNIALFESNKLKSEFLANVSHELRTPLNAIIGFAEILKEQAEAGDDEKSLRYVSNVLESGRLLLRIINELLDLAKVEAGKIQVRWDTCNLYDLADALANLTRPLYEPKQLRITLSIPDGLPPLETDPAKLQQILFNLLDNAIKFTPEKGRIDINAALLDHHDLAPADHETLIEDALEPAFADTPDSAYIRITIADTGPGINLDDRQLIFDKFRQLDGSVTRAHSGAGLGLAIVKEFTQILGGTITVADNTPHGAVFALTLPLHPLVKSA